MNRSQRLICYSFSFSISLPRGIYPSRISWNDPTTLAIACAKTIKIMMITTEISQDHQAAVPKKHMNTGWIEQRQIDLFDFFFRLASSFKIEFYACGLTSVNRDLVVLGVEDFSITVRETSRNLSFSIS